MVSVSMRNKGRGRAFQTKLAQMAGGMNIGTLGGEDVMHPEFSYEAKTYLKDCKSNKYKDWDGELMLTGADGGNQTSKIKDHPIVLRVENKFGDIMIILRWYWWKHLSTIEDKGGPSSLRKDGALVKIPEKYFIVKRFAQGERYLKQAEKNCPDGKLPLVVVHTVGKRHETDIVLLHFDYWQSFNKIIIDKYF